MPNSVPMNDWPSPTTTSTAAPISSSGAMSQTLLRTEKIVARTTFGRWRSACCHSWRSGGCGDSGTALLSMGPMSRRPYDPGRLIPQVIAVSAGAAPAARGRRPGRLVDHLGDQREDPGAHLLAERDLGGGAHDAGYL